MCGFCQEGTIIELARILTAGDKWPSNWEKSPSFEFGYLQECPDVFSALARVEHRLNNTTGKLQVEDIEGPAFVDREQKITGLSMGLMHTF